MAMTPSTMSLPLGSLAPAFDLVDTRTSRRVALTDFAGAPALVVMFICNHCPFVKHLRAGLASLGRDYAPRSVAIVAISSNDPEKYPDDAPPKMAEEARDAGYTFPYLFDQTQGVAKAYRAACTPDFYVFDRGQRLVYRGQFDDSRPAAKASGNTLPVTGADLRAAIDAVLAGTPVAAHQKPSIGCNIKWQPGNEPDYFLRPA